MRNRRLPPAVIPVVAFLAAGIAFGLARGDLTLKGLLMGVIGAVVLVFAATSMSRGPYI